VSWLGTRGVEARLSERLEVSSRAMSSAPPVLGKEGLLKPRGRHGYSVTTYSRSDTPPPRGPSSALIETESVPE
jgi:DNA-binding GntR family transcriptional regulator